MSEMTAKWPQLLKAESSSSSECCSLLGRFTFPPLGTVNVQLTACSVLKSVCRLRFVAPILSHIFRNVLPLSLTSSNWEMCADMFATFEETADPAKFKMKYWGAAAYLQTGSKSWTVIRPWIWISDLNLLVSELDNKFKAANVRTGTFLALAFGIVTDVAKGIFDLQTTVDLI